MTLPNMIVRFVTAALLGTALLVVRPAAGAPPNTIANSVAICDPWSPQSCARPDNSGNLPVTGTFSATLGGFAPATTGTPISVTTGGDTGTLPAGTVVVATNVGSNAAYCALGASATTASQYIAPGGGWFAFTVGAATQLTCITASSTTTVNMTGGAGLPTGTGGGGSGGGAVTVTPTNVAGVVSSSAGSNLVLKSSAGGLQTLTVTIGAVSGWIMVFDATSAPADGAVTPAYCRYVKSDGTGGATSFSWGNYPLTFSTGITAVFSSTGCFTKTASATATFQGQVQ